MATRNFKAIQIIGTQRSGSNLLRLILNQCLEISAHHPPHILDTFFPILEKYQPLSKDYNFLTLINDVCRLVETNPVKWNIELDRKVVFKNCEKRLLTEVYKEIYQQMAEVDDASFWCCKSLVNAKYFDQIESTNLKPYYIHLVRDGRDVASSFRQVLVGEKHPYHLANVWKSNVLKATEIEKKVGRKRFLTIQYESLTSDPLKELRRLSSFLGIKLDGAALDYFHSQESENTAEAGYMWRNVKRPIIKENFGSYKREFTNVEIEIFERVAGRLLVEFGYERKYSSNSPTFSKAEVVIFDEINEELKKQVDRKEHLLRDKENRKPRTALLQELVLND